MPGGRRRAKRTPFNARLLLRPKPTGFFMGRAKRQATFLLCEIGAKIFLLKNINNGG